MKSLFFKIFFSLGSLATSAAASTADICELRTADQPSSLVSIACALEMKALGCDSYFQENKISKEKMRTCNETETSAQDFLNSCGKGSGGFFSFLYDTFVGKGLKHAEQQAAENQQKKALEDACEADQSLTLKRSLESSARVEGVTRVLSDEQLKGRSCASLMKAVEARANFREFQEYVDKLQTKEFRSQWDDTRKNFLVHLKNKVIDKAEKAGIVLQCYNARAQTEIGCKVATAMVAGVAVTRLMIMAPGEAAATMEIADGDNLAIKAAKKAPGSFWNKLTHEQAADILGDGSVAPADKIRRAVDYIKSKAYPSAALKADDLETLLNDIHAGNEKWEFRKIPSNDKSTIYMGPNGNALIIDPQGKFFKGEIDFDVYSSRRRWFVDYKELQEL